MFLICNVSSAFHTTLIFIARLHDRGDRCNLEMNIEMANICKKTELTDSLHISGAINGIFALLCIMADNLFYL